MKLRLARLVPVTEVEGPGRRACLWVQGCSIRCPGCFNPHLWGVAGGRLATVDELTDQVLEVDGIEGITLLGGEPFDQAAPLAELGRRVRGHGLSVMTFTGFRLEQLLDGGRGDHLELLAATDLLVDGPFVKDLPDRRRPWVGSTNQRFHFLTSRYRHLEPELAAIPDRLELRLGRDGSVWINGMASTATLAGLRRDLGLRPATGRPAG
jgi:anaerobic ribonucleoside-triphosphate reductase activating protein